MTRLVELAAEVTAAHAAEPATDRPGAGRLVELAGWLARAQGSWPPRRPRRVRLLLVGVEPAGSGAAVPGALEEAAAAGEATVQPIAAPEADDAGIDAAITAGAAAADAEIDAGSELLLLAGVGAGDSAAAVVAALSRLEPTAVAVAGDGPDPGDLRWSASVVAIRQLLHNLRPHLHDPDGLLAATGSVTLATQAGLLLRAASRRTPVILDGVAPAAAAAVAALAAPELPTWCLAGHSDGSAAHREALRRIRLAPVLELGITDGHGYGALLALQALRTAVRMVADG